jgi:hypothetical protein
MAGFSNLIGNFVQSAMSPSGTGRIGNTLGQLGGGLCSAANNPLQAGGISAVTGALLAVNQAQQTLGCLPHANLLKQATPAGRHNANRRHGVSSPRGSGSPQSSAWWRRSACCGRG